MKQDIKILICSVLAAAVMFAASGCMKNEPVPLIPTAKAEKTQPLLCQLPKGHLVDAAFDTAYDTLAVPECRYRFDDVMQALLKVCEGAPQIKNKEKFSSLLVWAKDEGIISTVQARRFYTT